MRSEPPPPPRRRDRSKSSAGARASHQRCPYLEEIYREPCGPFHLLTRFRADCHVDRRTHNFTGRHPTPPCITDPQTCRLHQQARDTEERTINRYTD